MSTATGTLDLHCGRRTSLQFCWARGSSWSLAKPFWGPEIYSRVSSSGGAVRVADVGCGDGKPDLVVTTGNGSGLNVLRGRGYGTFDAPTEYWSGVAPTGLAVADFNGDGSLDIAVTNATYAGNTVTVLRNEPVIALFPSGLTFAAQTVGTTSNPLTATISNPGTSLLRLNSIIVTGVDASDFLETTTCSKSVVIAQECVLTIDFRPSAKGRRTALLKIADNALGRTQYITLQGEGQ